MMRRCAAAALLCCCALANAHEAATSDRDFDLGRAYRNGVGVERDSVRAFTFIESAARRDNSAAMFVLSHMLMAGEGAPKDETRARQLLEQAAALEYPEALQQLALNLQDGTMGYVRDDRRAAQLMREAAHALKHRAQPQSGG